VKLISIALLGAIIYVCWPFFMALGNAMLLGWHLLFYILVSIIILKIVYKLIKYIIKSVVMIVFRRPPAKLYEEET